MDHLELRGLNSSAEFLEAIFESSDDAITAATSEGIILIWNKGAEKLYGYTEQEVLGQHISIIAPEGHKKDIELVIQKVIHDSYLHHYRTVRRHKDGHLISVSVSASPIKNSKGEIIAVSAITRDLTEQDAAETKFKSLLESAPDAMVIIDSNSKITIVNSQTEHMFGYMRDEMFGFKVEKLVPDIFRHDENEGSQEFFNESSVRHIGSRMTLYARRKDGLVFPVEISLSPMQTAEGLLVIAAIRDITDRKKNEQEIHDLNLRLLKSAREAGMAEVASYIIHNIGNALNSLNVSSNLISETYNKSNFHDLFKILSLLKEHSSNLTDYFLNNPKGKLIPALLIELLEPLQRNYRATCEEMVNLSHGVQNICDIVLAQQALSKFSGLNERLQLKDIMILTLKLLGTQLSDRGITVTEYYDDVPSFNVDKSKLTQIFLNLIQNAEDSLKSSVCRAENKEINISITRSHENNSVLVIVSDNGEGISEENMHKLFDYGYTTKVDGHGIGLHSCAIYAEEMGAKMSASSKGVGQGASFIIEFPFSI
jgi:PAS domain S-box-containing protein